jgi:hypothetical protein
MTVSKGFVSHILALAAENLVRVGYQKRALAPVPGVEEKIEVELVAAEVVEGGRRRPIPRGPDRALVVLHVGQGSADGVVPESYSRFGDPIVALARQS